MSGITKGCCADHTDALSKLFLLLIGIGKSSVFQSSVLPIFSSELLLTNVVFPCSVLSVSMLN